MANPLFQKTHKHILDDDVIQATVDRRPTVARDLRVARLILRECSGDTGDCVYDHLSELINKIIDDRPPNVIDYFEEYSRQMREEHFRMDENFFQTTYVEPERLLVAKRLLDCLKLPPPTDFPGLQPSENEEKKTADDEEEERPRVFVTDVMQLQFHWSLVGMGFPQTKIFLLSCCMRKLEENPTIDKCRFWGQIFGLKQNYLIVEVDLIPDEIQRRVRKEQESLEKEREAKKNKIETDEDEIEDKEGKTKKDEKLCPRVPEFPDYGDDLPHPMRDHWPPPCPELPASTYTRLKDIPSESQGTGLNRKSYFVCNHLGEHWTELPPVTCKEICAARKIKKYFTGNLNAKIDAWPTFPGVEKNYLRATIARITSTTYVSPMGLYRIGSGEEEEEEEEEEGNQDNDRETTLNSEYDPMNLADTLKLSNWVHHRPYILDQGRVNWFNPKLLEPKEESIEEEEEEEEEEDGFEPEIGPLLMRPCSEDITQQNISPWSIKLNHNFNLKNAFVIVRSNLWPGAISYANSDIHDNLYIGWGKKFSTRNNSPPVLPAIEDEFPTGPEIMEINDPTVSEEDEWQMRHLKTFDESGEEENFDEEMTNEDEGED